MTEPYLLRLAARRGRLDLERRIVFGLVLGWLAVLYGVTRAWLAGPLDAAAVLHPATVTGALLLASAVIVPQALAWPERLLRGLTSKVGHVVLSTLLIVSYFALFTPLGLLLQISRGRRPICEWDDDAGPVAAEGWTSKTTTADADAARRGRQRPPLLLLPARVIGHFVRHRNYAVLPAVVVLVIVGLLLFFAQSSALAPFIYTLF